LAFDTEWTQDRFEENKLVNQIRAHVTLWLEGGYFGVTPTMSRLLAYWIAPDREKKKDMAAKAATTRTLWVPAVNNHGGFGRWAFIEIDDPRPLNLIIPRSLLQGHSFFAWNLTNRHSCGSRNPVFSRLF